MWQPGQWGALGLAAWLTACSSSTVIRSNPPGAKVYLDNRFVGVTPYQMTDTKIVGSTTQVRLEKEGYKPLYAAITRNEEVDVLALVGGLFLLVPFLWVMKYQDEHVYDLTAMDAVPPPTTGGTVTPGGTRLDVAPPERAATGGGPPAPSGISGDPPAAGRADPGRADALNEEGKKLYSRGEYAAAARKFAEAVTWSREARLYYNLCAALDKLGDYEEALRACAAVYTHEPSAELRRKTDEKVETIRARKKLRQEQGSPAVR